MFRTVHFLYLKGLRVDFLLKMCYDYLKIGEAKGRKWALN